MSEVPVLGLRVGKEISPVHQTFQRGELLNKSPLERKDKDITDIWGMLQDHLKVDLLGLVELFQFDKNYKWVQVYHRNALSALFLASETERPKNLNEATGIIETTSDIKEGIITPRELAVIGIIPGSERTRRILAVGYNLVDKQAQSVAVSMTEGRIPFPPYYYHEDDLNRYARSFMRIPTPDDYRSYTDYSSLITAAMAAQTGHQLVLFFYILKGTPYFESSLAEKQGFYHLMGDNAGEVGFKNEWAVTYPTSIL